MSQNYEGQIITKASAELISGKDSTDAVRVIKTDASGNLQVASAAQPGVDIGDVTVNNAAGASAVNIQDGGNSLTVDGTIAISSIAAGDNNIGNVDIVSLPNEGQQTMANSISVAVASDQTAVKGRSDANTNTIHASAAETATGNSSDIDVSDWTMAVFYLNVSASAGTSPTLDITIEGKDPIAGTYYTIVTFLQKVTTGSERIALVVLTDRTIRGKWTIGGSAGQSFTFSLVGIFKS